MFRWQPLRLSECRVKFSAALATFMPRKKALWVGIYPPKRHPKPRKRLQPVSKRRQAVNAEYAKAKREWKRRLLEHAQWWCARCCGVPSNSPHHTRGRAGRLICEIQFFMPVCEGCHNWIHKNPKLAQLRGFLCAPGDWNRQP